MEAIRVLQYVLVGLAAVAGGLVNALAGGGTLITFPMLTAIGIPAVIANVTNIVALCPGYLGATMRRPTICAARSAASGCCCPPARSVASSAAFCS
jgi:hypothetical protein